MAEDNQVPTSAGDRAQELLLTLAEKLKSFPDLSSSISESKTPSSPAAFR